MKHTTHRHHIIPKHAGGTNDPSNLVELSVEEHAEAHRKLYEQYGRWQDQIAWRMVLPEGFDFGRAQKPHSWYKDPTTNKRVWVL